MTGQRWQPPAFALVALLLGLALAWLPVLAGAALVGATAVFLLTLIQPLAGVGLVLLFGPFGALERVLFGFGVDSGQLFLLLAVAAWLARGLAHRRILIRPTFLNAPLGLFLWVMALTLLDAPSLTEGLKELLKWIEAGLILLLVMDVGLEMRENGRSLAPVWLITGLLLLPGLLQAAIGIWQFGLRGTGPDHFLVLGRFYRASGTFEQPNPYGGFINLSLLLAFGIFLGMLTPVWRRWRAKTPGFSLWQPDVLAPIALMGGLTGLLGLALIFSWSRGAWLGFAAGTAVLLFFWPQQRRWGLALLLGAGALFLAGLQLGLIPAGVADRLISFSADLQLGDARGVDITDANYAVLERLAHWQAALDMAREQLWWGVGFGNYAAAYAGYALINWPDALGHAHNYYLNLLAEVGVIGLLAYLGLWLAIFWQTGQLLRQFSGAERGIVLGSLAVWTALSVHHLVDKLYVNNLYLHLGVMWGLLALLRHEVDERSVFNS